MSQNKQIIFLVVALLFAVTPSHAQAFSYTKVHSLWQEPAYVTNSAPDYLGPTFPGWGFMGFFADPIGPFGTYPTYEAMCDSFATAQGYTNTTDFYCVFEGGLHTGVFGTPCFGTACSPGSGTITTYGGAVKLYTNPLTTISYAALTTQLDALWATYWAGAFNVPLPPVPNNPDVCSTIEIYNIVSGLAFDPSKSSVPPDTCNVYHHIGSPSSLPVATLTAASPSIVAGTGPDLLTYSCTNGATSASIDNGVGAVTPPAAGSVPVTPGSTTTYTLTCTNANGSSTATAPVTVVPALTASCSVSPTSISAGATATWSALASGGTGTYTYTWTGTDGLTGSGSSVTFPYGVAGPKTASVTVTSGAQSITSACSNTLTVNPGALPDLTVTTPPAGATSFTAGTAQSYSGSVQNIGGATATAYPNVMQVLDSTGNTSLAYFVASPAVVTTAAGAGSAVSGTVPAGAYPFNTAGTYKVRFCANMNNVGSIIISETSPLNNCGPNTPAGTITVVVGSGGTPALSCTVSPTSLPASGGLATWTVTPSGGATGPYTWAPIGFSGYSVVSPTAVSHTFTSADAGQNYSMHVSSANVPAGVDCTPSLPVGSVCAGSPTGTLTANPNRIRANTPTSITFALPSIQNVKTSCTLSGNGIVTQTYSPSSCVVSGSFTANISIPTQTTYTLTCDGLKTATTIINVLPNFQEF